MSEVLVEFDTAVMASDETRWIARVCGREAEDGLWEGWVEFLAMAHENETLRTPRETEQPNRDDLVYWAQGLTYAYLEGALARARGKSPAPAKRTVSASPRFSGPAEQRPAETGGHVSPRPILNPFEVFQQGEDVLVQELNALAPARLRDLVIAYDFATPDEAYGANRTQLTSLIVAGVRRPYSARRTETDADARGNA